MGWRLTERRGSSGLATFGWAVLRALLNFGYWLFVLFCLEGALAADRRANAPSPTWWVSHGVPITLFAVAVLIHAGASTAWRLRGPSR